MRAHPLRDEFWTSRATDLSAIDIPVFAISNWDEYATRSTARTFTEGTHPENRLVFAPGGHATPTAPYGWFAEIFAWLDHWLKGVDDDTTRTILRDPVGYYVMGAERWQSAQTWPPSAQVQTLNLAMGSPGAGAQGTLTTGPAGKGALPYLYVPGVATPSGPDLSPISFDQHGLPFTSLSYATAPLAHDVEVTGEPTVRLRAATSAPDTDWLVTLIDIAPDGTILQTPSGRVGNWVRVTNGQLRASHRAGDDHLESVPRNQPVDYDITMKPTSFLFKQGHRIALQITSADLTRGVPLLSPALNTVSFDGTSLTLPLGPA